MNKINNPKLTGISKYLRKNMTKEERHLWYDFLKTLPVTVNRQKVIGNYIVDFYIASARIVIELDGSGHNLPSNKKEDAERDAELEKLYAECVDLVKKEAVFKENSGFYQGVDVRVDPVRNYTDGKLAPHILGRVGAIDAEEYAEKACTLCVYAGQRASRTCIRYTLCTGTGADVRA